MGGGSQGEKLLGELLEKFSALYFVLLYVAEGLEVRIPCLQTGLWGKRDV